MEDLITRTVNKAEKKPVKPISKTIPDMFCHVEPVNLDQPI